MRAYWRVDRCGRQAILEALRTKLAEVCILAEGAPENRQRWSLVHGQLGGYSSPPEPLLSRRFPPGGTNMIAAAGLVAQAVTPDGPRSHIPN